MNSFFTLGNLKDLPAFEAGYTLKDTHREYAVKGIRCLNQNIIMNTIHLPILTLLKRVEEMKVNLDGLPLEYRARIMNDNYNNDLDYIIKELRTIKSEVVAHETNTLDGYTKDDADLFLGRNLDGDEWYDLKDDMLSNDYIWEQVGEYANEWIQDNIIEKENNNE